MGFSRGLMTVNSLLYTFPSPVCSVDTETSSRLACLCMLAVTQKVYLVSNFLCLLYFFVLKPPHFTRPPWKRQSDGQRDKIASFYRQNLMGWMSVCAYVCEKERGIPHCEVLTSAAGPCRDGMWYSPLHKGPWPLQQAHEDLNMPLSTGATQVWNDCIRAIFPQPLTLIKTTKPSLHTLMLQRWLLCTLFEVVVSELCETGGKLLQHCIMCLAQWVQYVSSSPLIVVSVLQETYHAAGGYTGGFCQQ